MTCCKNGSAPLPPCNRPTSRQVSFSSSPLSELQAATQALQPEHASRSTSKAYCSPGRGGAAGAVQRSTAPATAVRPPHAAAQSARPPSAPAARTDTGRPASCGDDDAYGLRGGAVSSSATADMSEISDFGLRVVPAADRRGGTGLRCRHSTRRGVATTSRSVLPCHVGVTVAATPCEIARYGSLRRHAGGDQRFPQPLHEIARAAQEDSGCPQESPQRRGPCRNSTGPSVPCQASVRLRQRHQILQVRRRSASARILRER